MLLAVTVALTTPAFATHAYRDETCQSTTHTMNYDGDVGYSDSYSLSKIGSAAGIKIWEKGENSDDNANYFEIVRSKGISSKIIKADCSDNDDIAYESTVDTSQSVLKYTIAKEDEAAAGLNSGTLMIVNCKTTQSYPVKCADQKSAAQKK
jgi:hypothetical protein